MALQIKGKFVENAAIDGDKVELKVGQSLKQKKADGNLSELIKLDESITEGSKVRVDGQQVALKSEVDGFSTQVATQTQALIAVEVDARIADVNAEEARALAAEGVLQSNIDAEETRALAAEAVLSAAITEEETRATAAEAALSAAITAEEAARIAGDSSTLSSANSYTDTKIAALVDAAPALLDTLNELAAALGDDPNFATSIANSVAAVQTAVDAEETRALAAEAALQGEIDAVEAALAAEVTRATTTESGLQAAIDAEEADRIAGYNALQTAISTGDADTLSDANSYTDTQLASATAILNNEITSLQSRMTNAEADISTLESGLVQEVAARESADTALAADIAAETSARQAADAALDGRVDALEAVAHYKEKFVLSAADLAAGYIELAKEAKSNSIVASVGRLMIHQGEGEDFTVSVVVAGKTRMTFVGNLIHPSPEELGEGDVIYVKYMA